MIEENKSDSLPDAEIKVESDEILAAFERVRKAREDLILKRRSKRYNSQTVERNWKSPVKED